ncbi:MAG: hypothetical protein AB7N76_30885 [Planctomycetota bacterium]
MVRHPLAPVAVALLLALPALADEHLVPTPGGELDGKTVVLSPGHGRMLVNGSWAWQRPLLHDIREDIHTNEIMIEVVQRYLAGAGARVEFCRERSFQTNEVIVDDPAAQTSGTWTASSATPPFRGQGYRYAAVSLQETATIAFVPDLPAAGRYPVYVWFSQGGNRATDALYRVHHTGGVSEVRLPQHIMGSHWAFLGEFHFAQGTAGKVVLSNQGRDPSKVVIADAVRFGGGVGPSGLARWREGARAYLTYKGFQSTREEVTIRPAYATWLAGGDVSRWRPDFAYVSLHTNAGGGQGTVSYSYGDGRGGVGPVVYTNVPSPLRDASDRLRNLLQENLVRDIRAGFDPAWQDRRVGTANFGELRECRNMASTLVELAFHDHVGDAARLRDPVFRHVAGRSLYKGLLRYLAGANAVVSPLPPTRLRLENLGGGRVRATWDPVDDALEPSAMPTGFKVYLSPDGFGFDDGRAVSASSVVLDGLVAGKPLFVKVAATNQGGEGLCTRVGGVVVNEPGRGALVVDGFDRRYAFTSENGERRYTHDYAVEHVTALAMALPAHVAVDYAENEAAGPGGLDLAGYALVDWLLGRESSATRTFDPTEQAAVSRYLAGGGKLLVSGSELGWDLGGQGGGAAFLRDQLGASYVADDAGAKTARGAPGGPFAALGTLDLSRARYDAASPDVLAAAGSGELLLSYEAGSAPPAGVGVRGKVVTLGFPLEALANAGQRAALTKAAIDYVDPTFPAGPVVATPPPSGSTTAPTTSSTAPGATATAASPPPASSGGGGGGGGCALGSGEGAGGPLAAALLLLALVGLRLRVGETAVEEPVAR